MLTAKMGIWIQRVIDIHAKHEVSHGQTRRFIDLIGERVLPRAVSRVSLSRNFSQLTEDYPLEIHESTIMDITYATSALSLSNASTTNTGAACTSGVQHPGKTGYLPVPCSMKRTVSVSTHVPYHMRGQGEHPPYHYGYTRRLVCTCGRVW